MLLEYNHAKKRKALRRIETFLQALSQTRRSSAEWLRLQWPLQASVLLSFAGTSEASLTTVENQQCMSEKLAQKAEKMEFLKRAQDQALNFTAFHSNSYEYVGKVSNTSACQ